MFKNAKLKEWQKWVIAVLALPLLFIAAAVGIFVLPVGYLLYGVYDMLFNESDEWTH